MKTIVTLAKVLSDINRVKILGLLLREKELCVCELCDTLSLSQPLVSRHLKQMKEAHIITAKQEGKWMVYSLSKKEDTMLHCCLDAIQKHTTTLPSLIVCQRKG